MFRIAAMQQSFALQKQAMEEAIDGLNG